MEPERIPTPEPSDDEGKGNRASKGPADYVRQMAIATELPFTLVVPVLAAGGAGYFLDRWLGTSPLFLIGLGLAGLYAGVREMLRRLKSFDRKPNDSRRP